MNIDLGYFGERIPVYKNSEEEHTAITAFLEGDYSKLTCDEVSFFRDCQEDPDNRRWEREHAGELLGISQLDVDGELFIHRPTSESLPSSRAWLLRTIGEKPITPLEVWNAIHQPLTTNH